MRIGYLIATAFITALLAASATVGVRLALRHPAPVPKVITVAPRPAAVSSTSDDCERRRHAVLEQPTLAGAAALHAVRGELVARAKAEPVLFLEPPTVQALPPSLAQFRERLFHDGVPWQALNDVFSHLKRTPKRLRQVLLTDGYLYAEKPDLAALLSSGISLAQMFTERELVITRGSETWRAIRKRDDYVWSDGPESGQPAKLWLFDRIAVPGESTSSPKHVSLSALRSRMGASRIEVERITRHAVLANSIYGDVAVPALFDVRDGRLELACEVISLEAREHVASQRRLALRRERVIERLRAAIAEQVQAGLPFDEPKTEEGQQDGKLRQEWRTAYLQGQSNFEFNGDQYPVFGAGGVPRIPQVCVDFITDSWERMADTRWSKREAGRARHIGRLDFDAINIENRRSVENLIDFALAHPEWFEPMLIPESERVAFADRQGFFRRLYELRSEFQPGDVVAILGPRDDDKLHYHSFFIVDADPLTAMPTLLAANAGRPRIRSWEGEMQNAPRRSIVARIRPRLEWLEAIAGITSAIEPAVAKL